MKILIIEDDLFFQKFYSSKLIENGFEIQTANDGVEGLAKIKEFKPDLVVLDIIMPNKDGYQVLDELNKEGITKKIPILVFSTLGQEKDVEKAMQLGATGYVNKSYFDFKVFLNKINDLLIKKTNDHSG